MHTIRHRTLAFAAAAAAVVTIVPAHVNASAPPPDTTAVTTAPDTTVVEDVDTTVVEGEQPATTTPASFQDSYNAIRDSFTRNWASASGLELGTPTLDAPGLEDPSLDGGQLEMSAANLFDLDTDAWLAQLDNPGFELDLALTSNSADWVTSFAALNGSTSIERATPEALAAGLLTTRAITNLAVNEPSLFTEMTAQGLASPETSAAWQRSLTDANSQILAGSTSGLLDNCTAGLLTTMATGDTTQTFNAAGDKCRPCAATGTYLHTQFEQLFTPGGSSLTPNFTDSVLPPAEFNQLPSWQREVLGSNSSELAGQLNRSLSNNSDNCGGGDAVTSVGASVTGSVFDVFSRTAPATSGVPTPGVGTNPFSQFGQP